MEEEGLSVDKLKKEKIELEIQKLDLENKELRESKKRSITFFSSLLTALLSSITVIYVCSSGILNRDLLDNQKKVLETQNKSILLQLRIKNSKKETDSLSQSIEKKEKEIKEFSLTKSSLEQEFHNFDSVVKSLFTNNKNEEERYLYLSKKVSNFPTIPQDTLNSLLRERVVLEKEASLISDDEIKNLTTDVEASRTQSEIRSAEMERLKNELVAVRLKYKKFKANE